MRPDNSQFMMFQGHGTHPQRLSKLYSDTKQSYESAKVASANANVIEPPEVGYLRRGFQIQQDRLLAWGMHWADVTASDTRQGDIDIDRKIDQAGLTEVVASVISEIKGLLEQSKRYEESERYGMSMAEKTRGGPGSSPVAQRKDWNPQEIKERRELLDQLSSCIDLLYSLEESRRADEKGGDTKKMKHSHDHSSSMDAEFSHIYDHPLHIDFGSLEFSPHALQAADPPPYESEKIPVTFKERSIAYYRTAAQPVLVDYLPADTPLYVVGSAEDVFEVHELGEKLCKNRALSWCGHLRLLGFTVNPQGPRCAMIYALPDGHDHQSLQQYRTLEHVLAATSDQRISSSPALEDRFRLAYNLTLSILGYFAQGETHQHINGSNILIIGSRDSMQRSSLPKELRTPYLLQSCQDFLSRTNANEPFTTAIYRHPDHDVQAAEVVPAYDIYSLGLILFEIGLWMPLTKFWKEKYDRATYMDRIQRIYSHKLAPKCGSRYMRVVQRCLDAPAELQYRNNYEDARVFLLQVAKDLQHLCSLDEGEPPPPSDIETFELLIIEQIYKAETMAAEEAKARDFAGDADFKPELPKRSSSKRKADVLPPTPPVEVPLRKWPEVNIPQEDLDQWNTRVMPKLGRILEKALKDSPASCSLSLMMFGPAPDKAKTTICVQSPQINRVRDVLRKTFKPKRGWGVVILNGDVRRSGKKQARRSGYGSKNKGRRAAARRPREQKYQKFPTNGASIGAFKDCAHLPPVSFGGTILVDGEPYGMTVHHMLDVPSDDEEEEKPRRAMALGKVPGQFDTSADVCFSQSEEDLSIASDLEISDDELEISDDESNASTIRPDYSIMDGDGNEFWFLGDSPPGLEYDDGSDESSSSSDSDDVDDAASVGDKTGVAPDADDDLCVTQPALDDVDDDFFPNEEDRDDDHLASHSFGYVFASSGIRRVVRGETKHEVDWALIRVHEERLKIENVMCDAGKKTPEVSSSLRPGNDGVPVLTSITPLTKLSGLEVHCRGRSSGFKRGRISQAPALVKMHGRQSFSTSWCVEAGGFGIPGDSGAWVYDPASGGLCGQVLAWGDKSKTAYIAPMQVLFEDIRGRLGARCVELPVPPGTTRAGVGIEDGEPTGLDIAAKLRKLDISPSAATTADSTAAGKNKESVGVRPIMLAGTVS